MRKRLNCGKKFKPNSHFQHNDLYVRFRKVFDIILDGDDPHKFSTHPDKWYVPQRDIEVRLENILNSEHDSLHYLIGRTGIGKSTVLRKCTKAIRNPVSLDKTLIVPFNFDNREINSEDIKLYFAAIWVSNGDYIKEELNLDYDEAKFIDFIKSHSKDVLYTGTIDPNKTDFEKLERLREKKPYTFSLEYFKYFFYQSSYDRVLLVIDDIESADHQDQVSLINTLFRAYNCIKNNKKKNKSVNVIISIRPNTYKLIRNSKIIKSHVVSTSIRIENPVAIVDIFKKRFYEVLHRSDYSHIKDKEEWKRTLEVLLHLCDSISDRYSNRFIALFNYNIRRTLIEFNQIIINRKWFQRARIPNPSFKIDELDYAISEAAVYRVLGLRNSDYYPFEGTCIPNLLHNRQEPSHDLVLIYIIKYLLTLNNANTELDKYVLKSRLINDFVALFPYDKMCDVVEDCLQYGLENKLFDFEHDIDNYEKDADFLFLTPRAKELYMMVGEKNLSLQLFRDDTYQDFSSSERRDSLTIFLKGKLLFQEMLQMSCEIYDWEKVIVESFILNETTERAIDCFGGELFSEHLLQGTRNSINAYFQDATKDVSAINDTLYDLNIRVRNLSNKLANSSLESTEA